jgi:hypothetical protein
MDMYPHPVMGKEREARLMNEHRMFREAEDPKARMAYLREMCRTRNLIAQEIQADTNEQDVRMHQDVRFWWDEIQRHGVWNKLDDILMEIATDPESELQDQSTFMEIYDWHIQAYLDRYGPYEMPDYDEEEARKAHMLQFDFAGEKSDDLLSQLKDGPVTLFTGVVLCDKAYLGQEAVVQQKLYKSKVGKAMFAATPFGQKRSPKLFATQVDSPAGGDSG